MTTDRDLLTTRPAADAGGASNIPTGEAIAGLHRSFLNADDWPGDLATRSGADIWTLIANNHRCNSLLWLEESNVRRPGASDARIAAGQRAINRYNQQRNETVEQIDELILSLLAPVVPASDAWLNSETAGSIIDRLSILTLKIHHWHQQCAFEDQAPAHQRRAADTLDQLRDQHADLVHCFQHLMDNCVKGSARFRRYRQHRLYNAARNPESGAD